jgi:hypothetical protein
MLGALAGRAIAAYASKAPLSHNSGRDPTAVEPFCDLPAFD